MKRLFFLVTILIMAIPFAYALELYSANCHNDGRIEFTVSANNKSKAYTKDIKVTNNGRTIDGSWNALFLEKSSIASRKYGTFISKEGYFQGKKEYTIDLDYVLVENQTAMHYQKSSFPVICPGLIFTCTMLNISINDCYMQEDKFKASLTINGLKQSKEAEMDPSKVILFNIKTENIYLDKNKIESRDGSLPPGYSIYYLGNDKYLLEFSFKDNFVNSIFVQFNNDKVFAPCNRDKYDKVKYYDLKSCSSKSVEKQEIPEEATEPQKTQQIEEQKQLQGTETKIENKTAEATEDEISSKAMIIIAAIFVVIGIIIIFLLKKRDISS